jgi:hypothetical protein
VDRFFTVQYVGDPDSQEKIYWPHESDLLTAGNSNSFEVIEAWSRTF